MQQDRVRVADIVTRNRLRPVSEAGVESLMASIAEIGVMKDAIHVRKKKDGSLHLIAGGHRLEAARRLGWDEVEAKVWSDVTDDWARLMEIDDNLAGAEMNALDTAVFLATRKAVYERLHPETKRGVAGALARWDATDTMSVAFVKSTAEKFGLSERHIRRLAMAGESLGPDHVDALRAAPRPVTLKDLTEIAKIGAVVERYDVVRLLAEGEVKSAAEARRALKSGGEAPIKDPVDEAFKALKSAWARAPKAAKRRFLDDHADDLRTLLADLDRRGA
ncbi:chromosome partitioning protein, ParB family [Gemmobacter aquatilis]|uniref:Chromosome partitioning protein, ParB family n=2 Tax=Gemmobacter aquatilis TaxID=933059 RepID=A0A1H8NYK5_9RHOB|nr:chromosome partitioning protein, ParB family [Gemmobacter aquatilis]